MQKNLSHPVLLPCLFLSLLLAACGPLSSPASPLILNAQLTATAPVSTPAAPPDPARYLPPALAAEAQRIRFGSLSIEDGLSQSVITGIVQDDQGFLWFSTQEGLNRYDGYEFKVYKNDPENPNSLPGNFIQSMDRDASGVIWMATISSGLVSLDPRSGQFTRYRHDPQNPDSLGSSSANNVLAGRDGMIWVGTGANGLDRLDPQTGKFSHYRSDPDDPDSLSANTIFALLEDDRGAIWMGTDVGGLNRLDRATGKFRSYSYDPEDPASLSSVTVQSLFQDHEGVLWVGTTGGLNRFNPDAGTFTRYQHDPEDPTSLSDFSVTQIFEDRQGRLWIGTNGGGLNIFDRESETFTRFLHDPNDPDSLANNQLSAIYEDRSGMLWFGTFGSGIASYDPYKDKFLHITVDPRRPEALSSSLIWSIYQDQEDFLWIGTHGGGLNRFDLDTGEWKHYLPGDSGLIDDKIYTIYEDDTGIFWLGTNQGLHGFDRETERFQQVGIRAPVLPVLKDGRGMLWFGTAGQGLGRLDLNSGEIAYYQHDANDPYSLGSNVISTLYLDEEDTLWVGTNGGGLNRYDPRADHFIRFMHDPDNQESLSNDSIMDIVPAGEGKLWLGTLAGLNLFDPAGGRSTAYQEKDGLPNNVVYGILHDDAGNLWLSTNRGISRFNPQTLEFKNYDHSDGLSSNEFNQGAFFKNEDGLMFFGTVSGVNFFHPDRIRDNPYVPPVVVTKFELFNQEVPFGEGQPLAQPVESSREIRLDYTDDFFSFEFASLHFSAPEENRYAYWMEGLDKGWVFPDGRRFASYTNVTPGEYTFHVKASNSDGVWNEQGVSIDILIPPPFWQTTWFRVLVVSGTALFLSGAVVWRIRSIENQRQKLEVLVQERTSQLNDTVVELEKSKNAAEAANRAKSVFLANMSHEFRTPLNAILGFTQVMARDGHLQPDQHENVEIIHRSSEHLLGLINDVLEMSKIEAGRTVVAQKNFDLHHMLHGLAEMFRLRAEEKSIHLTLDLHPQTPGYIRSDEGKLRQVLMNLLGNAVKFTQTGQITLRVYPSQDGAAPDGLERIGFEVEDTGPGIAPDEIERMFLPFVQTSAGEVSQEGTGLGLSISQQFVHLLGGGIQVTSAPGKGSTFRFSIPVEVVTAADLETPGPRRIVVGLEPGQPTYRMLFVDDQAINRKLLVKLFAPLGFEVREAADGKEALEIWQEWQPHLIWMDMRMPVMDGYEATRQIKATTRGQATIIVALTASGLEEDKAVILSEGCDDYMRKPFREDDLFATAARHLGVRYIYQDAGASSAPAAGDAEPVSPEAGGPDLAARLADAGPDWVNELERAAVLGDAEAILRLANQLPAEARRLSQGIQMMANQYDHEGILILIGKARRTAENEPG